jgi:dipeptidase
MEQYSLQVLNPVAVYQFKPLSPAKRLKELKNKKIGLYWNHKARGNIALERVKELLSERFEGMTFEWFETPISSEASPEWFETVRKSGVDGIVASTGD